MSLAICLVTAGYAIYGNSLFRYYSVGYIILAGACRIVALGSQTGRQQAAGVGIRRDILDTEYRPLFVPDDNRLGIGIDQSRGNQSLGI